MNRAMLEMVRCMLSNSGLPKIFWAETVDTALNLINRSPSTTIGFKIPQKIWCGKPSRYEYLRVFGRMAYAH